MKKWIDILIFDGLLLILDDDFLQIASNIPIENLYDCNVIIWSVYIKSCAYTNNDENLLCVAWKIYCRLFVFWFLVLPLL